jgi:membrane-bound lytic murein transglycosylase B
MSKHALHRRARPVRRFRAVLACTVVTAGTIAAGVATTSPARPEVIEAAAQVETPPEVPVEVRPVAGYEEPPPAVAPMADQSVEDIPDKATAAYQRAESVIADARPQCHLTWTVLAAVGRVESDHGRADGGVLGLGGRVDPPSHGPTLDGRSGRPQVSDTDAGVLDGLRTWDRTVGPLNFLPATWEVVGVDGDRDGHRDPQDIDDAALAAAVVLCGKHHDLATSADLATALAILNPAPGFAAAVTDVAEAYDAELEEPAAAEPEIAPLTPASTVPAG